MGVYLQGSDPATFGVPNATAAQIQKASTLIDSFLNRPEGLICDTAVMDNTQQPINVVMNISPRFYRPVILDRKPVNKVLSVNLVSSTGTLTPVINYEYIQGFGLLLPYVCANKTIQIEFLAGWLFANIPLAIKQACANIINDFSDELTGSVLSFKMGDGQITRKSTTDISSDTQVMLAPWKRTFSL